MKTRKDKFPVGELIEAYRNRSLFANPEYQRGLVWSETQQQRLIDSVFRGYPLPVFFLRESQKKGLRGTAANVYEIIDGQQRLRALSDFKENKWETLTPDDKELSLPDGVKQLPCAWGGKTYGDLADKLRASFDTAEVDAVVVEQATDDEVRDLFIRLQAGTALTRQQVRDAWPGPVAEYVKRLAGHRGNPAKFRIFREVDKRGKGPSEDYDSDADPEHDDRQTCAQVICLFVSRESNPAEFPSLTAKNLDDIYRSQTSFKPGSPVGERFEEILTYCEETIFTHSYQTGKLKKRLLFSLFSFFQDLTRAERVNIDEDLLREIGEALWDDGSSDEPKSGKVTSPGAIYAYYRWLLDTKLAGVTIAGLDERRTFPENMKKAIWAAARGKDGKARCSVCNMAVELAEGEYDHKLPWIQGGLTEVSNGRLVHAECHARGKSAIAFAAVRKPKK